MLTNYTLRQAQGIAFTGQHSYIIRLRYMDDPSTTGVTEGFGLMFYNARMYDPVIGRFTQADSVLDNPVTGWDRYAYVNNSPINYVDPSGHYCLDAAEAHGHSYTPCSDDSAQFSNQSSVGTADVLSQNILSPLAQKLYDFYRRMYADKNGWWWDAYGEGGFTIWEFIAIQWGLERDRYPNAKNFRTALANASAVWCSSLPGCDMSMPEWNLNFLAAYTHRPFSNTAKCIDNPRCDIASVVRKPPLSNPMQIVIAIQGRPSLLEDPVGPNDLFDVGNVSLSEEIYRRMIMKGLVYEAWGDGNTMVLLTKCQSDYLYYASQHGGAGYISKSTYHKYCG